MLASELTARPLRLDLIGHATRGASLLRLGADAIDMFEPRVVRFFEELANERLLARLGITAVRLLGCHTATSPIGQRTMHRLARVLDVPVYGSRTALLRSHYGAEGLLPIFDRCLVATTGASSGLAG